MIKLGGRGKENIGRRLTIVDPELLNARHSPNAVPSFAWSATSSGIQICSGILLITPASEEKKSAAKGWTVVKPSSAHAIIHKMGAAATKWNRWPKISINKPTSGLNKIGKIFCAVDKYPATASVYPRMKIISAEFTLKPPAAPLCSNCVAGSIKYAHGRVSRTRQEKIFLTCSLSVVMARSRSEDRRKWAGTAVRSKST